MWEIPWVVNLCWKFQEMKSRLKRGSSKAKGGGVQMLNGIAHSMFLYSFFVCMYVCLMCVCMCVCVQMSKENCVERVHGNFILNGSI